MFAHACSWAISYQFPSLHLLHSQLSLMAHSPQSSIHFTKLNIPTNKTIFSSLIRSVPYNILTAFLLTYSTSTLENSLPELLHHIQDENLREFNITALFFSTLLQEHHLDSVRNLFSAKFYIIVTG